jgi:hypothetical protein
MSHSRRTQRSCRLSGLHDNSRPMPNPENGCSQRRWLRYDVRSRVWISTREHLPSAATVIDSKSRQKDLSRSFQTSHLPKTTASESFTYGKVAIRKKCLRSALLRRSKCSYQFPPCASTKLRQVLGRGLQGHTRAFIVV